LNLKEPEEKTFMIENVVTVTPGTLIGEIAKAKYDGYRFVTMTCVELDADTIEVIYHFDRNLTLKNYRLNISKCEDIPSISHIFMAAFLVENEIQDFFNVAFSGLIIDFKQTLYLEDEAQRAPLCRYTVSRTASPEPANQGDA
jgi:ech hydrogenase subunit D